MQRYAPGTSADVRRRIGVPNVVGAWLLGLMSAGLVACNFTPSMNDGAEVGEQTSTSHLVAGALTHPELRDELLEMMAADQLERTGGGLPEGTPLPPSQDYVRAVRLEEIVAEHGWPTFAMVGRDGSSAAWVIAQHADFDVDLQWRFLRLVEAAVEDGQADMTEMAYLWDRVAVNRDLPQRYGSQIRCRNGEPTPATPIEDADEVDVRRAEVGMSSLDVYYEELAMMCAQEDVEG